MKRLCVFAHWDKDNIIDDYVVYYLKALKEVCETIIFVSDTENTDPSLIKDIVDHIIIERHGEYDFGSYKRGFLYAINNNLEFDELVFVNDSCYGPLYPLKPIFEKMEKKKCDWWGMTQNNYGITQNSGINVADYAPHIQSYFIVFKPKVFNNTVFINFINNITVEKDKLDVVIKYEVGLSRILNENKFINAIYINKYRHTENCLFTKWKRLIKKYKFPFIKTCIIKGGIYALGEIKDWKSTVESVSDYPVELISKNSVRLKVPEENLYKNYNIYRKVRFKILNNSPIEIRKILIYLEKYLFIFFNTICFNKLKKF